MLKTNLQQTLKLIECPLYWSLGGKDSLVPAELAQILTEDYAQDNVVMNPAASHAPFISHDDSFIEQLITVAEKQRHHKL